MKILDNFIVKMILFGVSASIVSSCSLFSSKPESAPDEKYLSDFHNQYFQNTEDESKLKENDLSLFVDYSTCIAQGQYSKFYQSLVPSWTYATKKYYSIKGKVITEENLSDSSVYTRLLSIQEVNYADLKTAVNMMADKNSESVLLTDGEFYNPTIAGANANNPYMAAALKKWLKRGHDVFIIAEPYVEQHNGSPCRKNRFYFIFTDTRLKNNIYENIKQTTGNFKGFKNIKIFHLSVDHPEVFSRGTNAGVSSEPNPNLGATVTRGKGYEIQDWTVTWDIINDRIMEASDPKTGDLYPDGDYVIKDLFINRSSFGGYLIKDVDIVVSDINTSYTDYYNAIEDKKTPKQISTLPVCPNFMKLDKKELNKGGELKVYFDKMFFTPDFLVGCPNYFKIDFFIREVENEFDNIEEWFSFDLLGQSGSQNLSVAESIKQCLTDNDLQYKMKKSPFYTIYVKCNEY